MSEFKIVAADGSEKVVRGYKKAARPAHVKDFDHTEQNIAKLPAKVDLRPFMTAIENQGDTNSCTANATAGAYEYLVKRHRQEDFQVSRLFAYYNGRYVDDSDNIADEGASLSSIIDGLKQYGACSETTWPFDPGIVNDEPEQASYDEAASFLVQDAQLVPTALAAWKTALAAGHPIIFGLELYDSFDKQRKPGLVPAPTRNEASRESHSGHAMLCVGYSDPDQVFIVRNSWGEEWGDQGYCYIPYSYMMDPAQNDGDSWIIKQLEALPPEESTWNDDSESVLEDVSSIIASMTEEEYEALLDGMGEHPFERRLALIFLGAAATDGEVSEEEAEKISEFLEPVLEQTGGHQNAKGILKFARKHMNDQELITESVELIGEYIPKEALATIAAQVREAAEADGLSKEEQTFLDDLTSIWQVDPPAGSKTTTKATTKVSSEDEDEEEEEDEEEDEDEDEEEDEDVDEEEEAEDEEEEAEDDEDEEDVKSKKKKNK